MSKLKFDLSRKGLRCVLKPYQIHVMKHFWKTRKPMKSREVHEHLQTLGGDAAMSRASVINFLNDMVDEGFLDYVEETGKGGHHRVYGLRAQISDTERVFRNTAWIRFTDRLNAFRKEGPRDD